MMNPQASALAALLAATFAAGPAAFAGNTPVPAGQKGTLRVEFDQTGKNNGKPIHRNMTMVLHMQALPPVGSDPLAKADPKMLAEHERVSARLQQRAAAASVKQKQLDMDAIARACNRDREGAACKAGQKAFAESLGEMDQALDEAASGYIVPPPVDPHRFQPWKTLRGKESEGCGTVEGRVLDQGKSEPAARLPSSPETAELETCFTLMTIDTTAREATLHINPVQIRRANATMFNDYVINGNALNIDGAGDFDWTMNVLHMGSKFQGSGGADLGERHLPLRERGHGRPLDLFTRTSSER